MNNHVLRLDEVRSGDASLVGGKAANLGELTANGFPVPPGFVVSATASREFFEALRLDDEMSGLESDLPKWSAVIRQKIVERDIPAGLAQEIIAAHARLVAGKGEAVRCAVRSSATAEDTAVASFAGQHGTYYYVDAAHLLEMIRHCWASLWTPEAVTYRATHHVPHSSIAMAVVVQEMVPSEISGVTFTANPVNGDRQQIVIEASWGMGAAIVDGRVTPDRYIIDRSSLRLRERRIAEKRYMVPARPSGKRLHTLPQEMQRRETLRRDQVETIALWSMRCEAHFGAPQDVEWAIDDGAFYLLQSRPITTAMQQAVEPPKGAYVLFKPIAENFSEPFTPLMVDLMTILFPLMPMIGGRPYLDLKLIRLLLPFEISEEDLARSVYLSDGGGSSIRFSPIRLLIGAVGLLGFWLGLALTLLRTRDMPDDFMEQYRALCRRVENDARIGPPQAFARLWLLTRAFDPIGRMAIHVNAASLQYAAWLGMLRMMLRRWTPDLRPDTAALLCSGNEGVLSAEMGRAIAALAVEAKRVPAATEILTRCSSEEALAKLRAEPAAAEFVARLDAFLAVHGHRALKEFELNSPRWEENPAPLIGMIRNCMAAEVAVGGDKAAQTRAETENEVRNALSLGIRWRLVQFVARRVRYNLKLRENSRFYHIMAVAVGRRKILKIESELLGSGRLKCEGDIFFLKFSEIVALQKDRLQWIDVEDRVRERRIEYIRLSKTTAPRTIGIEPWEEPVEASGDLLRGQSASSGRCGGIARVILDPSVDATLQPGEILVAPYTDPAWTPLFLTAGAAVVEVGSYLSHAGTVAREFGMPCVVDVAGCTRRIETGDRVEVDGDRGTVRIVR